MVTRPTKFRSKGEEEAYDDAKEAMAKLLNLANVMGNQPVVVGGMLFAFVREHRTLQQAGMRNFVAMLKNWVNKEKPAMVDARNEDSWKFAEQVAELDPYFGCI